MTTKPSRCHARIILLFLGLFLVACSNKPESQNTNKAVALPPYFEGFHDITNCNGIMGWAWDKNNPDNPVAIDVFDGDTLLATVKASDLRPDLLQNGIGNGKHGFTYPVPPQLKDGKQHSIRMKFAGSKIDLTNTPKLLTCTLDQ